MISPLPACIFYLGNMSEFGWFSILTASKNFPEVHVYTDDKNPPDWIKAETNIIIFPISLEQIRVAASKILQQPMKQLYPYKLCDLKPIYPHLISFINRSPLEPFISIDNDVIFTNVGASLTLEEGTIQFFGKFGHCTGGNLPYFSTNLAAYDQYFGPNWRKKITSPRHHAFDEKTGIVKYHRAARQEGYLDWQTAVSDRCIDLSYWKINLTCNNFGKLYKLAFTKVGAEIQSASTIKEAISYIHLQKRRVKFLCPTITIIEAYKSGKRIFIAQDKNGDIMLTLRSSDLYSKCWIDDLSWKLKMTLRRATAKIFHEALIK